MGLVDKLKVLLDWGEDEFDDEELEEEELEEKPALRRSAAAAAAVGMTGTDAAVPLASAAAPRPKLTVHTTKTPELSVEIHVPSNFDQAARIGDGLLAKRAAVVNFERVDAAEQRRICDFINGVSYVLDCEARRISDGMAIYVPSGVDVATAKPRDGAKR